MIETKFLTLQSNASKKLYPKNHASHFTVQLPDYEQYDNKWRIGVAEIHIPLSFVNPKVNNKEQSEEDGDEDENDYDTDITVADENTGISETSETSEQILEIPQIRKRIHDNGSDDTVDDESIQKIKRKRLAPESSESFVQTVHTVQEINSNNNNDNDTLNENINYQLEIKDLKKRLLFAQEELRKSIDSCHAQLRESRLLKECGDMVSTKFTGALRELRSEENNLNVLLLDLGKFGDGMQKESVSAVHTAVELVRHIREHLIIEFLDYIKIMKTEYSNINYNKLRDIEYWKNNFIGLSYSAFANTREKNESHIPKYLYIYCDIVERRYVGDVFAPLLRVIRVPPIRMNGDTVTFSFDNPHFMRLYKNDFDTVEIYITDEKGVLAAFDESETIITLQLERDI